MLRDGRVTPRHIAAGVQLVRPLQSGLVDLLAGEGRVISEEIYELELKNNGRTIAPWLGEMENGIVLDRYSQEITEIEIPRIALTRPVTPEVLRKKVWGIPVLGSSMQERYNAIFDEDQTEMKMTAKRTIEKSFVELLIKGTTNFRGFNGQEKTLTIWKSGDTDAPYTEVATSWADSNSDPLQDLRDAKRRCSKATGIASDLALMGASAVDNFLNHPDIKEKFKYSGTSINGTLDLSMHSVQGLSFMGTIEGLSVYSYEDYFFNETTGQDELILDTDTILVTHNNSMGFDYVYAPILKTIDGSMTAIETPELIDQEEDPMNKKILNNTYETRPLVLPKIINANQVVKVIV